MLPVMVLRAPLEETTWVLRVVERERVRLGGVGVRAAEVRSDERPVRVVRDEVVAAERELSRNQGARVRVRDEEVSDRRLEAWRTVPGRVVEPDRLRSEELPEEDRVMTPRLRVEVDRVAEERRLEVGRLRIAERRCVEGEVPVRERLERVEEERRPEVAPGRVEELEGRSVRVVELREVIPERVVGRVEGRTLRVEGEVTPVREKLRELVLRAVELRVVELRVEGLVRIVGREVEVRRMVELVRERVVGVERRTVGLDRRTVERELPTRERDEEERTELERVTDERVGVRLTERERELELRETDREELPRDADREELPRLTEVRPRER